MSAMDLNIELKAASDKQPRVSKKVTAVAGVLAVAGCYALNQISNATGFSFVQTSVTQTLIKSKFQLSAAPECQKLSKQTDKGKKCFDALVGVVKGAVATTAKVDGSFTDLMALKASVVADVQSTLAAADVSPITTVFDTYLVPLLAKDVGAALLVDDCTQAWTDCNSDPMVKLRCVANLEAFEKTFNVTEASRLAHKFTPENVKKVNNCLAKYKKKADEAGHTALEWYNNVNKLVNGGIAMWVWIVLGAFIAALIGGGVFFFMKKKKTAVAAAVPVTN